MNKSKVFYTDLRCKPGVNLLQKLEKLVIKTGIKNIDFKDKFVAIKIHFGEPGNLAYLRSNYSKVIVDLVTNLGGKPFLTDCNTLYVGRRKNAIEHLQTAYENGYSPFQTNTHVIIGDGLKGTDDIEVEINQEYIKKAKIGRAIMDADIIIAMSHFKGHESTGFGGTLKNVGMGCGSRAGKMEMHNSGKPHVEKSKCVLCKTCMKYCAQNAIFIENNKASINHDKCVGCGRCIGVCNFDAIEVDWDESNDVLNKKIAEYAFAVVKNRPAFYINFVIDVSPNCDCHSENDAAIIPNLGILASFDPVALDKACVDMVNKAPNIYNSCLIENDKKIDKFNHVHPQTNWKSGLDHAVKIGLGNLEYELIEVK